MIRYDMIDMIRYDMEKRKPGGRIEARPAACGQVSAHGQAPGRTTKAVEAAQKVGGGVWACRVRKTRWRLSDGLCGAVLGGGRWPGCRSAPGGAYTRPQNLSDCTWITRRCGQVAALPFLASTLRPSVCRCRSIFARTVADHPLASPLFKDLRACGAVTSRQRRWRAAWGTIAAPFGGLDSREGEPRSGGTPAGGAPALGPPGGRFPQKTASNYR